MFRRSAARAMAAGQSATRNSLSRTVSQLAAVRPSVARTQLQQRLKSRLGSQAGRGACAFAGSAGPEKTESAHRSFFVSFAALQDVPCTRSPRHAPLVRSTLASLLQRAHCAWQQRQRSSSNLKLSAPAPLRLLRRRRLAHYATPAACFMPCRFRSRDLRRKCTFRCRRPRPSRPRCPRLRRRRPGAIGVRNGHVSLRLTFIRECVQFGCNGCRISCSRSETAPVVLRDFHLRMLAPHQSDGDDPLPLLPLSADPFSPAPRTLVTGWESVIVFPTWTVRFSCCVQPSWRVLWPFRACV